MPPLYASLRHRGAKIEREPERVCPKKCGGIYGTGATPSVSPLPLESAEKFRPVAARRAGNPRLYASPPLFPPAGKEGQFGRPDAGLLSPLPACRERRCALMSASSHICPLFPPAGREVWERQSSAVPNHPSSRLQGERREEKEGRGEKKREIAPLASLKRDEKGWATEDYVFFSNLLWEEGLRVRAMGGERTQRAPRRKGRPEEVADEMRRQGREDGGMA